MRWSVENWLRHVLKNERNEPAGVIRRTGKGYRYVDPLDGETLTVYSGGERVYRVRRGEETILARLTLESSQGLLPCQAPRAKWVEFLMNGERIRLRQLEKRDFAFSGDTLEGTIRGMLGKAAVIDTNDPSEKDAALFYMLASVMLHEDDVEII